ncbi:nucleotide disphospho-sugar-binding domain-containing protein [Streptomyces sp. NPDC002346]
MHHGSSGATFGAVARGCRPRAGGQEAQGRRVDAAGVGLCLPQGEQDPEAVAAALDRVFTEPAFTAAADRLRDEIAAMPSASEVAAYLTTAFA